METAEEFLRHFPTISNVYDYFAPQNWGKVQKRKDELAVARCVTLGQLDDVYGVEEAAKTVVFNNLVGVYSMGMNRELMNKQTADTAADLFVARYGGECTMFAMMIYFSGYLMDYKGTYANYDVQDILGQFSKKFLPWWRQKQGMSKKPAPEPVREGPKGAEGLKDYLMMKLARGEDLRSGGLWDHGFITEETVREIETYAASGAF